VVGYPAGCAAPEHVTLVIRVIASEAKTIDVNADGDPMSVATEVRTDWQREVRELAAARNAVLLAHNYQIPEIQDVADHRGD
jgi:quinolinate synthase